MTEINISDEHKAEIDTLLRRARDAVRQIEDYSQEQADELVKCVAWAIYNDDNARLLAEQAVRDTSLGSVEDKVLKNKRKTLGTLNDLMQVRTVGIIENARESGIVTYGKPVGVVGSLTPSTNPAATPANQAMMALKSKNAIIISPSPTGAETARLLKTFVDKELEARGHPTDLFLILGPKISFAKAQYLAERVDLLLVTGDQRNVRNGYRSGTPCIGVGKGNVPVILDETCDLVDASQKIAISKSFDNATSCSSENAVVIFDSVYENAMKALEDAGGYRCSPAETKSLESIIFSNGSINPQVVGKPLSRLAELAGITSTTEKHRFFIVEPEGVGPQHPLSGEKLCLVLSSYRVQSFEDSLDCVNQILDFEGIGHSVGIHTMTQDRPAKLAEQTKVARVLVNQAHTFGNGGGLKNNLPFTLSMGCGTWAGNSISENLSYRNFYNVTKLVVEVDKPDLDADVLFADFSM